MISEFNDGRSRSYFCRVATFQDVKALEKSIEKAKKIIRFNNIKQADKKSRANLFNKLLLNDFS